jgi:hypothetical protein
MVSQALRAARPAAHASRTGRAGVSVIMISLLIELADTLRSSALRRYHDLETGGASIAERRVAPLSMIEQLHGLEDRA